MWFFQVALAAEVAIVSAGWLLILRAVRQKFFKAKRLGLKVALAIVLAGVFLTPVAIAANHYYHSAHDDRYAYTAALKTNWPFTVFFAQTLPSAKLQVANMQDDFFRADYRATSGVGIVIFVEKPVSQISDGTKDFCAVVTSFVSTSGSDPAVTCMLVAATNVSKLYADQTNYYFDYKGTRVQIDQTGLSSVTHINGINGMARSTQLDQVAVNIANVLTAGHTLAR